MKKPAIKQEKECQEIAEELEKDRKDDHSLRLKIYPVKISFHYEFFFKR